MSLEKEVRRYSQKNGYEITTFTTIECPCGCDQFHLLSDDDESGAYCRCLSCDAETNLQDSRQYIENEIQNICRCDHAVFRIGVGVATYAETDDPRWIYVGATCANCGLEGVYLDWNER